NKLDKVNCSGANSNLAKLAVNEMTLRSYG
ncbi:MAG: hypothetical protein RJB11_2162, partial [Planctomycetota bacterium]